jgi:dUTP pyrophosphatase
MVLNKQDIQSYISQSPPLIEQMTDPITQIQPNGIDLTLDKIFTLSGMGKIDFSNQKRVLPQKTPLAFNNDGFIKLEPGVYGVSFKEIVNLPDHITALGRPRSSLIRMGASVVTAVWDAGYSGRSEAMLTVQNNEGIIIYANARLLQLIFFQLTGKTVAYDGIYQGENIL